MSLDNYSIPGGLVQATLNLLLELPAKHSHDLLNHYKAVCVKQEEDAAQKVEAGRLEKARKDLLEELAAVRQEGKPGAKP